MSDLKNSYKEKALAIAQKYLGMTPKDLGCENFAEMNEKLANEILDLINSSKRKILILDHDFNIPVRDFSFIDTLKMPDFKIEDYSILHKQNPNRILLDDMLKMNTDDLLGKTKMLKNELGEMEEEGIRGVTNNRKTKKRKKAKNGNRKNK